MYCKRTRINKSFPEPLELKPMEDSSAVICLNDPYIIEADIEKSIQ